MLVLLQQDGEARDGNHPEAHGTARQEYAAPQKKQEGPMSVRQKEKMAPESDSLTSTYA